ncbi:MAG TPA: 2-C-methyl-D-erythritol 2,4-cyclodiphosphate synthase [Spirochaetota bacterium]|nr:2-C-methyl-D-erythritol 2,4-cyclodiphosphate synthase [Spirochaetota bacterium]HPI89987.1 2-C-methyl-D-erythritol 2,4-cyclodiphosphate synthase [Spirochaetota bacterium]HPR48422.1 2-C-methyl-D-erythritol 2,4-cyclodiphosphate synthase [Spirochaetota bacterium]
MTNHRIGCGFDVHAFAEGRDLILGGVKIDYHLGLQGHSDADVLTHAIMDALLGAASLPDIGQLFPDTSAAYKNINSLLLLKEVYGHLAEKEIAIVNVDATIICEKPKIARYIPEMKTRLSTAMGGLSPERIGLKGTTTEGLGFTGRGEGIAVQAVALICLNASRTGE